MNSTVRAAVRLRSVVLWCSVTAGTTGAGLLAGPALAATRRPTADFTDLLVGGCGAAMVMAACWLWVITTDVAVRVLVAGGRPATGRCGRVRALLLSVCGVAALNVTAAAPAGADEGRPTDQHSLAGLPFPDRATGHAQRSLTSPEEERAVDPVVLVRRGDSLWTISEERLGPGATVAALVEYWHRIHRRNRVVVGHDPDLILPGQRLSLPPIDVPAPSAKSTRGGRR